MFIRTFPGILASLPGIVLTFASVASGQTTQSHSNTSAIAIPSAETNTTGSSGIVVSGRTGLVSKVTVTLNNITAFLGELDMMLVAPTGARFVFLSDSGSQGTQTLGATLTFDDAAASFLAQTTSPGSGSTTWKPTNHLSNTDDGFNSPAPTPSFPADFAGNSTGTGGGTATFANKFNGLNPNGTWTLYIDSDVAGAQPGVAGGWTLTITTEVTSSPTTLTLSSSPNPSFRTAPGNVATLTATLTSNGSPVSGQTIGFTAGGATDSASTNASGVATTTRTFTLEGDYLATASFAGTGSLGASSASSNHTVVSHTTGTPPTFCNDGNLRTQSGAAPAASIPYPQIVTVSGLTGTVSKVRVTLNQLSHPFPDDLDFLLVGPGGQKVIVMADAGGTTSTVGAPVTLTFDDAGAVLPDGGALTTGTYAPANYSDTDAFPAPAPSGPYASTLAAFNGTNPNGDWRLFSVTDVPGSTGNVIGGYCVTFIQSSDVLSTTTLTATPSPSTTGSNVSFTAEVRRGDNNAPVTSGTVSFFSSGALLGTSALNGSGIAAFATSALPEGARNISATFNGIAGVAVSTANIVHQVDNPTQVSGLTFCNPGPVVMPGAGAATQYPSRINVSGLAGSVSGVSVQINNLTFNSARDLDMLLAAPGGQHLVFWSDVGSNVAVSNQSFTITDSAASQLPVGVAIAGGTYRPTAVNAEGFFTFPPPAPAAPYNSAAPSGASTLALFSNTNPNGFWSLFAFDDIPDATVSGQIGNWCLSFTLTPPDISITKTHTGSFSAGSTGTYTIRVTNNGPGATAGTVSVVDTLPAGLTVASMSGSGWSCDTGTATCTRSDSLAASASFPDIALVVNVASNADASVTNRADVSGGGDPTVGGNNRANDVTTIILPADLTISKSHAGSFQQGQQGTYSIVVSNSGTGASAGTVTVADNLPAGLTAASISGSGWTCTLATLSCTRSDSLAASASWPAIALVVNVASNAPSSVTNQAVVTGGSDANTTNNVANDPTAIGQLIGVTIGTSPAGLSFTVDGTPYTSSQVLSFVAGSSHTLATTSPQGSGGTRQVFQSWSDGGAISHSVTASAAVTSYIASFTTQHELTTAVTPAGSGSVAPNGGFFNAGSSVALTATPNACYVFGSWSANATGGSVLMNAPQSVTATFLQSIATNVTGQIAIVAGGFRRDRVSGRWLQTLTLTNNGPALQNTALALDALTGGTLFNPSGATSCAAPAGAPLRTVGAIGAGASLSLTLEFTAPTSAIGYSPRVLAGNGQK